MLITALFARQGDDTPETHDHQAEGLGRAMYRDLSAVAHGTLYAILSRMDSEPDPDDEHMARGFPVVKLDSVVVMMAGALLGFLNAADRQVLLHGWFGPRSQHWPSWRMYALRRIHQYLSGASGRPAGREVETS